MKKLIFLLISLFVIVGYVYAMDLVLSSDGQESRPLREVLQKRSDNCCNLFASSEKEQRNQKLMKELGFTETLKCPKLVIGGIFILGAVLGTFSAYTSNIPMGLAAGAVEAWGCAAVYSYLDTSCDVCCKNKHLQLSNVISGDTQDEAVIEISDETLQESS